MHLTHLFLINLSLVKKKKPVDQEDQGKTSLEQTNRSSFNEDNMKGIKNPIERGKIRGILNIN